MDDAEKGGAADTSPHDADRGATIEPLLGPDGQPDIQLDSTALFYAIVIVALWITFYILGGVVHILIFLFRPVGTFGWLLLQGRLAQSTGWHNSRLYKILRWFENDRFVLCWFASIIFFFILEIGIGVEMDPVIIPVCLLHALSVPWIASRRVYTTSVNFHNQTDPQQREKLLIKSSLAVGGCVLSSFVAAFHYGSYSGLFMDTVDVMLMFGCAYTVAQGLAWARRQPFFREQILGEEANGTGGRDASE